MVTCVPGFALSPPETLVPEVCWPPASSLDVHAVASAPAPMTAPPSRMLRRPYDDAISPLLLRDCCRVPAAALQQDRGDDDRALGDVLDRGRQVVEDEK